MKVEKVVRLIPRDEQLVLARSRYLCEMCGYGPRDDDPFNPGRKIQLVVLRHLLANPHGDRNSVEDLRSICNNCAEGLEKMATPCFDRLRLISQVRRATRGDQLYLLDWLIEKFPDRE